MSWPSTKIEPFSVLDVGCTPQLVAAAEATNRRVRVSYDSEYDRLLIARHGELIDDQLIVSDPVTKDVRVVHRGGQGAPIGIIVEPVATWEESASLGEAWNGPLWDAPLLDLAEATPNEMIRAACKKFDGQSSRDEQLFHQAVEADAPEKAIRLWRECLAHGNLKAHFGLGYTLVEQDRPSEAYVHLRKYTQLVPENAWAWGWLGKAAEAMGERETARRAYSRAIAVTDRTYERRTLQSR